jgi:hypothetical protein
MDFNTGGSTAPRAIPSACVQNVSMAARMNAMTRD